jgi:hypothetical protein
LGKTLGEIDAMPRREFEAWREFYVLYPFDDLHRYHRPAALVSVSLGGGDLQQRIDWLQPPADITVETDPLRIAMKKANR